MKIAVSLYFWGEGLIPAKISNVLGVSPTQSQAKGEVKTTSTGKKVTAKGGMCEIRDRFIFPPTPDTLSA